ncbi:hypothetical protein OGAPHI_000993 [Ogataea philodendri]|uniref:Tubulin gamma chain n=1 Tax=Ogataea philodendri TaxID=1378263 RepID=A0A9P8PDX4_9ASCO|nr:uncharacterized protein OGAPHI_000993 [Ogataea philodendri]KAH3670478.1 hypothetical protein OGAPHI_000993 [Ogataea philodendri]
MSRIPLSEIQCVWTCESDFLMSTLVSDPVIQNTPALDSPPTPIMNGIEPYIGYLLWVSYSKISTLYSRYGSVSEVSFRDNESACSGIPYTALAPKNETSRATDSGPNGSLSSLESLKLSVYESKVDSSGAMWIEFSLDCSSLVLLALQSVFPRLVVSFRIDVGHRWGSMDLVHLDTQIGVLEGGQVEVKGDKRTIIEHFEQRSVEMAAVVINFQRLKIDRVPRLVGEQFWGQICNEHGILLDGTTSPETQNTYREDQTDIFFQRNDNNRYTPRAILIDMEPRVINNIKSNTGSLFNPKNIYVSAEGGGAGNKWAEGYNHAHKHREELMDMLSREMDACDSFEGFQLIHSVAGGTGAGIGSFLLQELSDRFSKKLIQTYSVFGASEVVVQPYNTVLTLKRLIENSDANIVFDNNALMSIASNNLQVTSPSYNDTNKLISTVMSAATNTLRFPGYSYNSLTSILSTLIPSPDLHFLIPSYTPFTSDYVSNAHEIRRSTAYDVILEVLDKKLRMCSSSDTGMNLSVLDIIIGEIDQSDVQKALVKARTRLNYVPWSSSAIHMALGKKSPFHNKTSKQVSGLMLSNSTSILKLLKKTLSEYDQLKSRGAFLNNYTKGDYEFDHGDISLEFDESREVLKSTMSEYRDSEEIGYLDEIDPDEEAGSDSAPVVAGDVEMT